MAGHSQSPAGSLALTSTLPYLKANESKVRRRALRMGLMGCVGVPTRSQPHCAAFVQLQQLLEIQYTRNMWYEYIEFTYASTGEPPCSSRRPDVRKASPTTSAVNVGRTCKKPSSQNEFDRLLVYHWNSQFCVLLLLW